MTTGIQTATTPAQVRCPNCGNPMPIPTRQQIQTATCTDCGEPLRRKNPANSFQWGILRPIGLLILAASLVVLFLDHQKALALRDLGVETTATVTALAQRTDHGTPAAHIVTYQFKVPGSDQSYSHQNLFGLHELWTEVNDAQFRDIQKSRTFRVRYDPQDPSVNIPAGGDYRAAYADAGIVALLGFLFIAKSFYRRLIAKSRRAQWE